MARGKKKGSRLRRLLQLISLSLFLFFLFQLARPSVEIYPWTDIFLRLDPLVSFITPLAARQYIPALIPGLLLLFAAVIAGRFFCGWLCPFGATLDVVSWLKNLFKPGRPTGIRPGWKGFKYFILTSLTTGALIGMNWALWFAPLSLITRFYSLLLYPLLILGADRALVLADPGFGSYVHLNLRAFDGLPFLLIFFGLVFILEIFRPRFWCRVLCPAGALLALISRRPFIRRRVGGSCTACGRCGRQCPTAAISPDGRQVDLKECLVCRNCQDICPESAVTFLQPFNLRAYEPKSSAFPLSRRAFIGAMAGGAALAGLESSSILKAAEADGDFMVPVRPPGSIPEEEFLRRCLRCAECLQACPSNALALVDISGGLARIFTPRLFPTRGPCEPDCNRCTKVCPTLAIRPLSLDEKMWAKIGTAKVLQGNCLAWAEDRRCVVCQEVCPFGSLDLRQNSGLSVPVPVVEANRCFGCGYCEHHCPVSPPAIVVESHGALRLNGNDYHAEAVKLGLDLDPANRPDIEEDDDLPPGFVDL